MRSNVSLSIYSPPALFGLLGLDVANRPSFLLPLAYPVARPGC